MIVAIFCRREDDCHPPGRDYLIFDAGLACGSLILRATELGLVAHPIAGYKPGDIKETLGIPEEYTVITLIVVGEKADDIYPHLSKQQLEWERRRPERMPLDNFAFHNHYPPQAA